MVSEEYRRRAPERTRRFAKPQAVNSAVSPSGGGPASRAVAVRRSGTGRKVPLIASGAAHRASGIRSLLPPPSSVRFPSPVTFNKHCSTLTDRGACRRSAGQPSALPPLLARGSRPPRSATGSMAAFVLTPAPVPVPGVTMSLPSLAASLSSVKCSSPSSSKALDAAFISGSPSRQPGGGISSGHRPSATLSYAILRRPVV